jgi:hypothetical protein
MQTGKKPAAQGDGVVRRKRSRDAADSDEEEVQIADPPSKSKPKSKPARKQPRLQRQQQESDPEDDIKKSGGRKAVVVIAGSEGEGDRKEQAELYSEVLEGIRRNESVVIDTRLNFTHGLPKKARIARTREQWRSMQNVHGKLTNNYAQIDITTIKIDGPLILDDIQPVRADSNNFRFLFPEEMEPKCKNLPRNVMLGTPISIARKQQPGSGRNFRNEVFGSDDTKTTLNTIGGDSSPAETANESGELATRSATKKPTLAQEWIYWWKDVNSRRYPMTQAVFAHLYRAGRISKLENGKIEIASPTGFRLFCDEDRVFVIPSDFCPDTAAIAQTGAKTALTGPTTVLAGDTTIASAVSKPAISAENNGSLTSESFGMVAVGPVTPAVLLSKSASTILTEISQSSAQHNKSNSLGPSSKPQPPNSAAAATDSVLPANPPPPLSNAAPTDATPDEAPPGLEKDKAI